MYPCLCYCCNPACLFILLYDDDLFICLCSSERESEGEGERGRDTHLSRRKKATISDRVNIAALERVREHDRNERE